MKILSRRFLKPAAIVAGIILLFVLSRFLPFERWLQGISHWVDSHGALGVMLFAGIYVLGCLLFVPGSILTLTAGAIFGFWLGIAVALPSATLGAAVAFLIARHLARETVDRRVKKKKKLKAIDDAIGEQGWKIVALLRLSPMVPFSFSNYFFGVTSVKFWPYVLASFLGMLPGSALYVYFGHAGKMVLGGNDSSGPAKYVLLGVGLIATLAVSIYIARLARRKLRENKHLAPDENNQD